MIQNNLFQRVISAALMASGSVLLVFNTSELVLFAIVAVFACLGTFEYYQALTNKPFQPHVVVLLVSCLLFFIIGWFFFFNHHQYAYISIVLLAFLLLQQIIAGRKKPLETLQWFLFPLIWISFPLGLFFIIRFSYPIEVAPHLLIFLVLVVSFNDMFAYFGGKRFGKHKLAPTLSPKKTIEGSFFGVLGGFIAGLISIYVSDFLASILGHPGADPLFAELFSPWKLVIFVLLIVPVSQIGDLLESKFKRYCSIKDSGNLIPGHGGLLDRIDAFLLAIPVFWFLLQIIQVKI